MSNLVALSLPEMFRPLLWSFDFEHLDLERHKEDIIVNAINEGSLEHWRWLAKTYGPTTIRRVLAGRLATEFHPESRRLAEVIFDLPPLRHAR